MRAALLRLAPLFVCWIMAFAAHAEWRQLAQLQQTGARVSAAAVDLDDNAVIQRLNADQPLTPASLSKLVVAAAALDVWPANQMFRTRVYGSVAPRGGTLAGDLIVQGSGDTSLTGQDLWLIAAQLKSLGVRRIGGGVKMRSAPFPSVLCETKDRCEAKTKSDTAYNTLLSSIGVDYGTWCLDIRAAQVVGSPAIVNGCSVTELPIPVLGSVTTAAADDDGEVWAERRTGPDGADRMYVGGRISLGSTQRFYRSMSNPALGTGALLSTTLNEVGIDIAGPVAMYEGPLPTGAVELAAVEGLALKEQLGRMLRFSNNYIADVLTLGMASKLQPQPPTTLADASSVLTEYLVKARQRDKQPGPVPPRLASGSGLTPENLLSANDLVALLRYVYREPRNFGAFYGGLTVPRDAPFPFLRQGSARWQNRVALKTGTMSDPHSVCGVAGYLRKQDGGWIAFAVIVNGGAHKRRIPLYKSMQAIKSDVDGLLARF